MARNGQLGRAVQRPDSELLILPDDGSRPGAGDLVECCHCGRHHLVAVSLGALLGGRPVLEYCARCDGVHCAPECRECIPLEQQLENMEAGRDPLAPRPLKIWVPDSPLSS